jgi:hypothetical protein
MERPSPPWKHSKLAAWLGRSGGRVPLVSALAMTIALQNMAWRWLRLSGFFGWVALLYLTTLCLCRVLSPGQTRKHCCGNICDSWCFLKCFPVCPPMETLLRKQNLLPEKQKCFLANSETFYVSLCFSLMFPSVCPLWETWRNIGRKQCFRNNVS